MSRTVRTGGQQSDYLTFFNFPQNFSWFFFLVFNGEKKREKTLELQLALKGSNYGKMADVIYWDFACAFSTAQFRGLNLSPSSKGITVPIDVLFHCSLVATNTL